MADVVLRRKVKPEDAKSVPVGNGNKSKKSKKGGVNRSDSTASVRDKPTAKPVKTVPEKKPSVDANTSYLKRVKSKIYRPKTDNCCAMPSMPEISENGKSKRAKNKKNDAKSKESTSNGAELRNSVS